MKSTAYLLDDQPKHCRNVSTTDLLFTMTGACGVPGGVSSVNLNLLYALAEIASEAGIGLTVFSFQETDRDRPEFLPDCVKYVAFNRNKFRLASSLLNFARKKPIYIFDYLKLSLPVLPLASAGLARTVIFAHGQEYWRSASVLNRLSLITASSVLTNSFYTLRKMEEKLP